MPRADAYLHAKFYLYLELGPGHIVLGPSEGGGTAPNFRSMFIVAKLTAGWIKMSLGTEVGLGPGDIVLDGVPVPPSLKGEQPRSFRPMSIELS